MSEQNNESTPEANLEANVETNENTTDVTTEVDLAAELDKWKKFARKHEDTVKALTPKVKEFEAWQDSQKTEAEKLAAQTSQLEARALQAESKLLKLEIANERNIPYSLLEIIKGNTREELEAAADILSSSLNVNNQSKTIKPNPEQGKATDNVAGQITSQEQLATMTPAEINNARLEGRLDTLLGRNK